MMRHVGIQALVLLLSAAPAFAADWPQWRGPNRDGITTEQMRDDWQETPPKFEWLMEGLGRGYASLSVVDGDAYTTGNFDNGQCAVGIVLDDRRVMWRTPLTDAPPEHGYPGSRSTPTVDRDRIYVVASDGKICCLNRITGKIRWSRPFTDFGTPVKPQWGFAESPLVDGNRVICTPLTDEASMVALDKMTGEEVWRSKASYEGDEGKPKAGGYSSIFKGNGAGVPQYVQMTGQGVIGVRAEDGQFLWSHNEVANPVAVIPTPIVWDDHVFASSGYGDGGAVKLTLSKDGDGVKATKDYFLDNDEFQNHHGQMIRVGNHLYAGNKHNKGFPVCLDLETGKFVWGGRIRGEGKGSAALVMAGDQLIFRYQDGVIAFVRATTEKYDLLGKFTPKYQEDKSWAHPVVYQGSLLLREQDKLMSYAAVAE